MLEELDYQKLINIEHSLKKLKLALDSSVDNDAVVIDASIHRFHITFELLINFLQDVADYGGVKILSIKDVFKSAYADYLIDNDKVWLQMLEDRKLILSTYDHEIAYKIYQNLPTYCSLIQDSLIKIYNKFFPEKIPNKL